MTKRIFIRLLHDYDGAGEGEVKIDDDFFNYPPVYQLDILKDCIYELEHIYKAGVKKYFVKGLNKQATDKILAGIRK